MGSATTNIREAVWIRLYSKTAHYEYVRGYIDLRLQLAIIWNVEGGAWAGSTGVVGATAARRTTLAGNAVAVHALADLLTAILALTTDTAAHLAETARPDGLGEEA